jgi:hypothetical protein
LTQLDNEEAISVFGSRSSNILLGNVELSAVDHWLGLSIYGSVLQGDLPPMDS